MAKRPVFIARGDGEPGVHTRLIQFDWYAGFSMSQKQRSIASLHASAHEEDIHDVLEISSKSTSLVGVDLSAFNLVATFLDNGKKVTVESAFQGSKVFDAGGPFVDIMEMTSREAKKDVRLRTSGDLINFRFFDANFDLVPTTFFYDWIYVRSVARNERLRREIVKYRAFTDIEFNPEKSFNCQAHAAALCVSLSMNSVLDKAIQSVEDFRLVTNDFYSGGSAEDPLQKALF